MFVVVQCVGYFVKCVFQVLCIEVNVEFNVFVDVIFLVMDVFGVGGCIVVMLYQLLEDCLVKQVFVVVVVFIVLFGFLVEFFEYVLWFCIFIKGVELVDDDECVWNFCVILV